MRKILITSIMLFLAACSVYKVDVQQGNVLDPKGGMSFTKLKRLVTHAFSLDLFYFHLSFVKLFIATYVCTNIYG